VAVDEVSVSTDNIGKCNCCNDREAIGVAAIPGIPMSVAWCLPCLQSGAIPYWAAVANTSLIGGIEAAAEWWKDLIEDTLAWHNKTWEEFQADVAEELRRETEDMKRMQEEEEARERSGSSSTSGEDWPEAPSAL
jgi:hypothetical protein